MVRRKRGKEEDRYILFAIGFIFAFLMVMLCNNAYTKEKEPPLIEKPSYVYVAEGKPDPFEPFIIKKASYKSLSPEELRKLKMLPVIKTELQRIKLSDIKIVAMIKTKNKKFALVEGPTGKGYIVKAGMGIGTKGGIIEKIVYEDKVTPLGKKAIRKIIIKEPFIDKNKKLFFRRIELSMGEKNRNLN